MKILTNYRLHFHEVEYFYEVECTHSPPPPTRPLVHPKKVLLLSLSLAKKRIYLDTNLKEELTDLFWKLPGYSLLTQAEYKGDGKHFANG